MNSSITHLPERDQLASAFEHVPDSDPERQKFFDSIAKQVINLSNQYLQIQEEEDPADG